MDIGAAIKAPFEDPDWVAKCGLTGLCCLVPIVGVLNLLGWLRQYARNRLEGRVDLPEVGFRYVGAGWQVVVAMLPLGLLAFGVFVVGVVATIVLGVIAEPLAAIPGLLSPLLSLAVGFLSPVFLYRHAVHNDRWASARFGWALALAKAHLLDLVMLWLLSLVATIIGGLGYIALLVGAFITIPLGQAMFAAGIAEFARTTNAA
jgi:hypothetical protein